MKLVGLHIDDFRQFKDFRLNFTDPDGKPLEKVCFIGPNGTGKSTLLRMIYQGTEIEPGPRLSYPGNGRFVYDKPGPLPSGFTWEAAPEEFAQVQQLRHEYLEKFLMIICPADGDGGKPLNFDLPATNLNNALVQQASPFFKPVVGLAEALRFWNKLIFHVHERRKKLEKFQRLPENRDRTISQLDAVFNPDNPEVLPEMGRIWNNILDLAGLEFDVASASIPFHLTDNLEVFVRTKGSKSVVSYGALSTGIIHYLFRLGHIWSLYFNRPPSDSVLLVDEPEGSLYPDFLYDIVQNYRDVAPGCQLFMATHSPIVASQFKPEERFILTFGDDGYVTARRGVSPEGDDPNDILRQDFGVGSLMTEVGERAWQRFLKLRRLIPAAQEPERGKLIDEYTKLGTAYHFAPPGGHNGNGDGV